MLVVQAPGRRLALQRYVQAGCDMDFGRFAVEAVTTAAACEPVAPAVAADPVVVADDTVGMPGVEVVVKTLVAAAPTGTFEAGSVVADLKLNTAVACTPRRSGFDAELMSVLLSTLPRP